MTVRRVLVCNTHVPFTRGGAEEHADGLVAALRAEGYEAEVAAVPFNWQPAEAIVRGTAAWRLLDVTSVNGKDVDLVVPLKFPTWAVQHPCKVAWVLHQHRSAYNLAGGPYDDLGAQPSGRDVRALIERTDQRFLPECRAVFANSATVADRLRRYSGVEAEALLHPPPLADQLAPGPAGDHILCVGRVEVVKRQNLLIAAMEHVKAPVRLVLAGTNPDERWTREIIDRHGVADRVDLLGFVDEKELLELYATALAVAYVPVDEDLGYVALQAMAACRPVITTADAGGAASFVVDGTTGHVVEAEVFALAGAIDAVAADRRRAAAMGAAGRDAYDALDLSWPGVVARLIDAAGP